MIVRIMEEGQFRIPSSLLDELNVIDNRIVDYVAKENESDFKKELGKLIAMIKENGKPLDDAEIMESDLIVPPADLTLKEAADIFSGDGLIED
jgi:CBS domain-containing protein